MPERAELRLADRGGIAARKSVMRDRHRTERQRRRDVRRIHRACFWTWPWGHRWEVIEGSGGYGYWDERCVGCGWVKRRWDHA
jgi:hypothetical protein